MTQASKLAQIGSPGVSTGFKNRIINGAMMIDQRNAGASVAFTNGYYSVDRFVVAKSSTAVGTLQQSTTVPAGFKNSLVATCTTGASPSAAEYNMIWHMIEGLNVADLGWGTADAKTITISFWARSSLTGTFAGALANSGYTRGYVFTYTISAANTWEYKTVTIAGDTTGTWLTDNGVGIRVTFDLGTGSNNQGTAGSWSGTVKYSVAGAQQVMATTGATFYITGVQLEVGTTATEFEYVDYGRQLAQCQRYYGRFQGTSATTNAGFAVGISNNASQAAVMVQFPVPMRTGPTISVSQLAASDLTNYDSNVTGIASQNACTTNSRLLVTTSGGMTALRTAVLIAQGSTSGYVDFTAEL